MKHGIRGMKPSRRGFLTMAAAGAAGIVAGHPSIADVRKDITVEKIDLFPVLYPTVMRFKFFEGPAGSGRASVIVRVTASDGTEGWGESIPSPRWSYETFESVQSTLEYYLRPVVLGRNPFDIASIHNEMNREIAGSFSVGAPIAKAGVDLALHDLIGKAGGVNVSRFWDRVLPERLPLSWTLNPKTLDDLEPLIAEGQKRGYRNFNVKVAPDAQFDVAMCKRVRMLVPEGFLWADANGGYDLATAREAIPRLADAGVDVLEQPLPANRLAGYQELRRLGALPIILDEGVLTSADLAEFMALECCDGVAMKVSRCGGLQNSAAIMEMVEEAGLMALGSGLTDPDISMAASLVLYGAFGVTRPAALNGPQFLDRSVITHPLEPVGGMVAVPSGPGLGIEVDLPKLEQLVEETKRQRR